MQKSWFFSRFNCCVILIICLWLTSVGIAYKLKFITIHYLQILRYTVRFISPEGNEFKGTNYSKSNLLIQSENT